jgi:hypothetical protein
LGSLRGWQRVCGKLSGSDGVEALRSRPGFGLADAEGRRVRLDRKSATIAPAREIAARALGEDGELVSVTLDPELGDYIRRMICAKTEV